MIFYGFDVNNEPLSWNYKWKSKTSDMATCYTTEIEGIRTSSTWCRLERLAWCFQRSCLITQLTATRSSFIKETVNLRNMQNGGSPKKRGIPRDKAGGFLGEYNLRYFATQNEQDFGTDLFEVWHKPMKIHCIFQIFKTFCNLIKWNSLTLHCSDGTSKRSSERIQIVPFLSFKT